MRVTGTGQDEKETFRELFHNFLLLIVYEGSEHNDEVGQESSARWKLSHYGRSAG